MKRPLLEYLDQLEADTKLRDQHSTMINPGSSETLALIAKLREAVQIARDLSLDIIEHSSTGVLVRVAVQDKIDALMTIEVPE